MKVFEDPGDLLWTHLELLRKCKLVAVTQKPSAAQSAAGNNSSLPASRGAQAPGKHKQVMSLMPQGGLGQPGVTGQPARKTAPKNPVTLGKAKLTVLTESKSPNGGNRSGNNGQVKLQLKYPGPSLYPFHGNWFSYVQIPRPKPMMTYCFPCRSNFGSFCLSY